MSIREIKEEMKALQQRFNALSSKVEAIEEQDQDDIEKHFEYSSYRTPNGETILNTVLISLLSRIVYSIHSAESYEVFLEVMRMFTRLSEPGTERLVVTVKENGSFVYKGGSIRIKAIDALNMALRVETGNDYIDFFHNYENMYGKSSKSTCRWFKVTHEVKNTIRRFMQGWEDRAKDRG